MHKEEKVVAAAMRAGFTLIEILVAVAIIGVMSTVAIVSLSSATDSADAAAVKQSVDNFAKGGTLYHIRHHKFPSELRLLVVDDGDEPPVIDGGEDILTDPWGTDYKIELRNNGKRFVVVSAGPDMSFDTEDDIRSDKVAKKKQQ